MRDLTKCDIGINIDTIAMIVSRIGEGTLSRYIYIYMLLYICGKLGKENDRCWWMNALQYFFGQYLGEEDTR
jgi:hypothetical protein